MPATAMAITSAAEPELPNFSVFCVHKTMPAALRALFAGGSDISGLLLPGHVTTIIGADAYTFLADELGLPCAVTGFEPLDIMLGIELIMRQIETGAAIVDNVYARAVHREPTRTQPNCCGQCSFPATACGVDWG